MAERNYDSELRGRLGDLMHHQFCGCGSGVHWRSFQHYVDPLMPAIVADRQRAVAATVERLHASMKRS